MAVIAGTVTYPEHEQRNNIVQSALGAVEAGALNRVAIHNFHGCCLGGLSFRHETKRVRTATIGNSGLIWTGYVNNIEDLRKRLEACGTNLGNGTGISQILLESYLKFGIESLQGLNGLYSIALWDGRQRRFSAITDRYGFTKIYYWHGPNELVFASECKSILTHPKYRRAIDKEGIINFLGAGYCFGERTLLKDIKLIPQGCLLEYENSNLTLRKYWDYSVKPVTENLKELTDRFFFHIDSAFKRCINGEKSVFIPLSGGLDSRTMAGIAKTNNLRINGCTVGYKESRDAHYGRSIGRKICTHHSVFYVGRDYIKKFAPRGIRLTDGLVLNQTFYILKLLDYEIDSNILVSGFLGDILTGNNLVEFKLPVKQIIKQMFLQAFDEDELPKILTPALKHLVGINSSFLGQSLNNADAENISHKSMITALKVRQRRYTSYYLHELGRKWNVVSPFTCNEFVDFILTLPLEMRMNQKLYLNAIKNKLPFLANIPVAKNDNRMQSTWWSWRWEYLKNKLSNRNDTRRKRCVTVDYDDAIRSDSSSYFNELFSDREHMVDLFDIDAVNKLFKGHTEGHINENKKLCSIASIIEWRRQFDI